MATTAVKSRIIKWRGRTRKGSRPSYINREGVSGMSSRPSSCSGFRGVGEQGDEDIQDEKDASEGVQGRQKKSEIRSMGV